MYTLQPSQPQHQCPQPKPYGPPGMDSPFATANVVCRAPSRLENFYKFFLKYTELRNARKQQKKQALRTHQLEQQRQRRNRSPDREERRLRVRECRAKAKYIFWAIFSIVMGLACCVGLFIGLVKALQARR